MASASASSQAGSVGTKIMSQDALVGSQSLSNVSGQKIVQTVQQYLVYFLDGLSSFLDESKAGKFENIT